MKTPTNIKTVKSPARSKAAKAPRRKNLEDRIVEMAASGELAKFGREAIQAQLKAGISVTYVKDDKIVQEHPDGRIEVVEQLEKFTPRIPPGVPIIGSK